MKAARDANMAQLHKKGFSGGIMGSRGETGLVCFTIQPGKK